MENYSILARAGKWYDRAMNVAVAMSYWPLTFLDQEKHTFRQRYAEAATLRNERKQAVRTFFRDLPSKLSQEAEVN